MFHSPSKAVCHATFRDSLLNIHSNNHFVELQLPIFFKRIKTLKYIYSYLSTVDDSVSFPQFHIKLSTLVIYDGSNVSIST